MDRRGCAVPVPEEEFMSVLDVVGGYYDAWMAGKGRLAAVTGGTEPWAGTSRGPGPGRRTA